MTITSGGLINYNQKFIDTAEHIDTFIMNRVQKHPQIWYDRIPKGNMTAWEGLNRKSNIFHGGLGEQSGLTNWSQIQVSRKPSGDDPGIDACDYNPRMFDYSWETVQYTGHRCSWQSEPVCINDIRWTAEGKQQCMLITSFMAYITQSVWTNWNHERYVKTAVDAGNAFILTEGGLDYSDDPSVRFTYDPQVTDSDGDTYIEFSTAYQISTLNWSFFDWWQDYLGDQCPEAAIAMNDQMPVFGLMIHKRDFNKMIMGDPELREDLRYAKSEVLIADYRKFSEWKGWALIHDPRQMRFKVKSNDGTTIRARRVEPRKLGRTVTIGRVPVSNPDYANAELAVGVIFMNEIFQNLIPTPIANPGGGMIFGAQPGYNGDFRWINEYDKDENKLQEVGYFFARFEAFPKPLMYSSEAIVFLYRRCPQTWATVCACACNGDAAATATAVGLAADAASGDVDTDNNTVTLTLTACLNGELGASVTLTDDADAETTGIIAEDSQAPTYVFAVTSAPAAYTSWTAAGSSNVVLA